MKKFLVYLFSFLILVVVVYLSGPKFPEPAFSPDMPDIKVPLDCIESYIQTKERELKIKPDNESRIIWANDSLKQQTEYCLLYLPGFSASWYEGSPVHEDFARRYGMNLYIPRLASHGLESEDALIDMTPDSLFNSTKEALALAHILGRKVIVMSTSTGGTLALQLAADHPELIDALYLYSPNVRINNPAAFLLDRPWGLQIARMVMKGKYRVTNPDTTCLECKYWYCKYRLEGTVYLQQLVRKTMTPETFSKVKAPVFLGYYYKDEQHQDPTVRVDALLWMFDKLGTPEDERQKVAFPEANTHVIACKLFSGAWMDVEKASCKFAEEKLGLKPIE